MTTNESNPNDRNRGILATVLFHLALVLLFIFYGLTYQDPPPEDGIAINFGYEDDGSGTTTQSAPQESQPQAAEPVEEEITTQEMVEAPTVNTEKPNEKPVEKPIEKPKEEQKPTPDSRLQGALDKTKTQQGTGQSEGETTGGGDQGSPNGDRNSPNRTGNGGSGGNGDYNLTGRSAVIKQKPNYDCDAEGRVIVKVRVDRNGKTIYAEPGANTETLKTNTGDSCLLKRAKEAALKTTWSEKKDAPETQVGFIIYNFQKR